MNLEMARRMRHVKASDIREILKVMSRPDMISFAGGLPAEESFPTARLTEIAREVLETHGAKSLQYSTTEGFEALREGIAARMNRVRGTRLAADEIQIVSGSQQGLDLAGKLFLDDGDLVFCESPTYLGALSAFQVFSPRYVDVPTDDDGMIPEALERCLAAGRPKFVYVIPDFQNPTGRRWSLERRQAFLEIVSRHGVPVLEDAPYTEIRFDDVELPALKALDEHDLVIHMGTFSKVFCPGLRLGWVAAQKDVIRKFVLLKQGTDLHTATFTQLLLAAYLERFDLDADVRRIRDLYRERRDVMLEAVDRCFPDGVTTTRPEGGMFLWVELQEGADARELLRRSIERNVAFVPGASFFPNGGHENTFRINFSAMPPARIAEGVERLAAVIRAYLAELPLPAAR